MTLCLIKMKSIGKKRKSESLPLKSWNHVYLPVFRSSDYHMTVILCTVCFSIIHNSTFFNDMSFCFRRQQSGNRSSFSARK